MSIGTEGKWVDCFNEVFDLSGVTAGDLVAVISESLSRPELPILAAAALERIGAKVVKVSVPTAALTEPVPVRSTGASPAFAGYGPILEALGKCDLVVDCTVEGLLHTPEVKTILEAGGRILMISNEDPEILERCMPSRGLRQDVDRAREALEAASTLRATSSAGTDLTVDVGGAPVRAGAGFLAPGDKIAYWPAGLCLCFPLANTVNGTVVFDVGDINLTFKRYFESRVTFRIEEDRVVDIAGDSLDAELLRSYYAGWDDPNAYTISHVGWGLNPGARWDALVMYDKFQINGTELRAFAGNFLISTGANEFAERYTGCHFDFPMRNCSLYLDDRQIVDQGRLVPVD